MGKKILKLYLVALVLGLLTGTVASCFQLAITYVENGLQVFFLIMQKLGLSIGFVSAMTSMILVLLACLAIKYIAPQASGSGIPEIEAALLHKRKLDWKRLLPVKFIFGVLSIAAKMIAGREGPTIQMGGNLGKMLGDFFGLSEHRKETLIAAGAAAGLAAAFNAPLAGALFVMEEMRSQFNYSFINFKMVLLCCAMAIITLHCIIGPQPAIQMQLFQSPSLKTLWLFVVFGILVGGVGILFNNGLMRLIQLKAKLKGIWHWIYILAVGALVGYLAYRFPFAVGGGYDIIHEALSLSPPLAFLCMLLVIRFAMTLLSYSTGVPGGIFAPMLALGTLLGLAAFQLLDHFILADMSIHPAMFAIAGMGGLFAATVRVPITAVVLIVEMTQNYLLILPVLLTCVTATTVMQIAGCKPIYSQLLRWDSR